MKKYVLLLFFCVFVYETNAQQDSLKRIEIDAGIILNPEGYVSLKNLLDGSGINIPMLIAISINRKRISFTPFYSIGDNSIGSFVGYSSKRFELYLVGAKRIFNRDSYIGFGIEMSLIEDYASMFFELDNSFNKSGFFCIGVCIPFVFKIK